MIFGIIVSVCKNKGVLFVDFEKVENLIKEKNIEGVADFYVDLFIENPETFRKSLLLSNSLPEPLERDFSEETFSIILQSFLLAGTKLIDKNIDISKYFTEFLQLSQAITIINKNSNSNLKKLEQNKYLDYSLSEQLQMMCIYIEDQQRLLNELNQENIEYITGMERLIAKHEVENYERVKVSATDNFEALIEITDTLFRLLYFKSGKTIEKQENFDHKEITPYELPSLEEIMHLAFQRNSLVYAWGKFKYSGWGVKKVYEEKDIYIFEPESKEDYKLELVGVNRYYYRDHINAQQLNARNLKENEKSIKSLKEIAKEIKDDPLKKLFNLGTKDYLKPNKFIKNILNAQLESLDEVYLKIERDEIKITDLLLGIEYLYTVATIYRETVLIDFNQEDKSHYKNLAPIIDKELLINHFKTVYGLNFTTAQKIIDIFVFFNLPKLDVFSQPLIYVGKNNVVFCPALLMQMNIVRIIELLTTEWKVNVSNKGKEFEKQLRSILAFNPHIKVNTNKIEFVAFDGKDIEFDFFSMFEDYILLIEFKHIKIPFSDKMKKNALDIIDYGVEQVNRRVNSIEKDWEKIRERCSFKLPENAPDESKIIKLFCTNIFNFSGTIQDGVKIIDSSSLLKYFMNPELKGYVISDKVEEIFKRNIWKDNAPTVDGFKEFINNPIAIQPYLDCFKEEYKPVEKFEKEDIDIFLFDYSLVKDPYENVMVTQQPVTQQLKRDIGRNDPCPCQSGKKFKKCCGK
jgi:SEC-C motif